MCHLIADLILGASEVDLRISEAKKIGAQLVAVVRDKSHLILKTLPASIEELRSRKGLMIEDILGVLSLSVEGYMTGNQAFSMRLRFLTIRDRRECS